MSMTEVIQSEANASSIRAHFMTIAAEDRGAYYYYDGAIKSLYDRREYMLLHLLNIKNDLRFSFPGWRKVPRKYVVTTTGVYNRTKLFKMSGLLYDLRLRLNALFRYVSLFILVNFGPHYARLLKVKLAAGIRYDGLFQVGKDVFEMRKARKHLYVNNVRLVPLSDTCFVEEHMQVLVKLKLGANREVTGLEMVHRDMEIVSAKMIRT
jgi:hypothetical protein